MLGREVLEYDPAHVLVFARREADVVEGCAGCKWCGTVRLVIAVEITPIGVCGTSRTFTRLVSGHHGGIVQP
jgi:hypothetical protein